MYVDGLQLSQSVIKIISHVERGARARTTEKSPGCLLPTAGQVNGGFVVGSVDSRTDTLGSLTEEKEGGNCCSTYTAY